MTVIFTFSLIIFQIIFQIQAAVQNSEKSIMMKLRTGLKRVNSDFTAWNSVEDIPVCQWERIHCITTDKGVNIK